MAKIAMTELNKGDWFIGPDGHTRYEVTAPASEDPYGWVFVRDMSMSDQEAQKLLETPGAVEQGCDPRNGFFAFSFPTYVEKL